MANNQRRVNFAGLVLVAVGVFALIANFFRSELLGLLFLPALGLAFIGWGLTQRRQGPLVPGGILTGLGVGTLLTQTTYAHQGDTTTFGILLLSMGLGFLIIIPLTAFIRHEHQRWELVPGGILTILGGILLLNNTQAINVLKTAGQYWPVLLIALGVFYLFRNAQRKA